MEKRQKAEALEKLKEQAKRTARADTGFAFGEGSPDTKLMIVGEAPGKTEEELGRPFVGAAGRLLNSLLDSAGIDRDDVWITNVVKWRPIAHVGGRVVNRAPRGDEVAADSPWLQGELEIIRPKVVLCLGNLAASTLIHKDFKMGKEHGKWFPGPLGSGAIATYHPAYVLRQRGPGHEELVGNMEHDFVEVKRALDESKTP